MPRSVFLSRGALTSTPTLPPPRDPLDRDRRAALAVSTVPIVLEGRYHLPVGALVRLRRSRRAVGQWPSATARLRSGSRGWLLATLRRPPGRSRTESRACSRRQDCSSSVRRHSKHSLGLGCSAWKSGPRRSRSRPATEEPP